MQNDSSMFRQIARELAVGLGQVEQTARLLDEGNTIPFIARYRKEVTGELDEVQIRKIDERLTSLRNLAKRKEEVIHSIEEQGKLTLELKEAILAAETVTAVEDLYQPYRPKRKTRASVAREQGLEPLAQWLLTVQEGALPLQEAQSYIQADLGVGSAEEALQGAMDIIAEMVSDEPETRGWVREITFQRGELVTEVKDESKDPRGVYRMYYEHREPVKSVPPHRALAINRGEREEVLKVRLEVTEEMILGRLNQRWIPARSGAAEVLQEAVKDGYRRLLAPSLERDIRNRLTEAGEEQAINVFSKNLRQLLLQPPVKGKVVLGLDPAYRTGCKWAVVDDTGKMLEVGVFYPTPPQKKIVEASREVSRLVSQYGVDIIAIGNGTASRETEQFVADLIRQEGWQQIQYIIVNEAGASVYSASELAAKEFPGLDVAQRSAASIARRLQDPLAELVKIEPRSIGVGQYQHDVAPKKLEDSLKGVVESAVNLVGVDLNTASPSLLSYVSGINAAVAVNIVKYREENGSFSERTQLKKVPRLGPKAFEQSVGFLRIPEGAKPLDRTGIHPESYPVVKKLLRQIGLREQDIGTPEIREQLSRVNCEEMAEALETGAPTLRDIIDGLLRPGRDPREDLPGPLFRTDILKIEDLKCGMELKGTVRNVVDFGVFVDIGLKNDGMVHRSELGNSRFRHPLDVVSVGDVVDVRVLSVDVERGRVALTMKKES
ncbi:Tex family protein [Desulforamulus ruminis]|uniref:Tex-like protein protein-like protein n=1 Tax=Desulforamulus ruminis (strain ATCC 23193 / DSM 2154 / NCIMB 8452 / DL) TaxID=696281 RepID=F6DT87_DESRL|nr:Tex family protein [Desulforamulus ruminis]AEG61192.1 Tex-like protein protein-like protein [Desulforamulus ruminis DSM 2154]